MPKASISSDANGSVNSRDAFRQALVDTLERHSFYIPSIMYGRDPGRYDFGPPGLDVQSNVLAFLHKHFAVMEGMLRVKSLYPLGLAFREEDMLEEVDSSYRPNLTGPSFIDPGLGPGYMRPETAQAIIVTFNMLYHKLPFAAAQIGHTIRKKITRQGLVKVRQSTRAEMVYFVDPDDKSHPYYSKVANLEFLMFPRDEQMSGQSAKRICLGEAVSRGIVNNQTLAYFIGRVYLFLTLLGINEGRLRFRQYLPNETANYALDCWDAEIESSYGWIKCVGIAERSAYHLRAHTDKSGVSLVAQEEFTEPREVKCLVIEPVENELGRAFNGNQEMVAEALEEMNEKEAMDMKAALESKGEVEFEVCTLQKTVVIKKNMVSIRVCTPSVIEPSFDIGRIIYCLYEHSFYTRPSKAGGKQAGDRLNVFRFRALVAPITCLIWLLVQNQQYKEVAKHISRSLTAAKISNKKDYTGKMHAIADELGVLFSVTVDSTSSVTIRERDSMDQIRVSVEEVAAVVKEVSKGRSTWADISKKFPAHTCTSADMD